MNSRLERLKKTIEKCEKVEETFAKHRIRGQEAVHYDDIIAGFDTPPRSGFLLDWDLVFRRVNPSASKEEQEGWEPTSIEVALTGGEDVERLILVSYFPDTNIWGVEGSTRIGGDGTEATRSLAADCRVSAGDFHRIGEDEAMKIIATLCAFYMSQPVTA
jgi:hypothetical protein